LLAVIFKSLMSELRSGRKTKKMAKIAEYKFTDYDLFQSAKSRLYDELGSKNYGESIRYEGSNPYWITIYDDCSDPGVASKICRGNGGEPYSG
jgi:hypothetical protein